LGLVQDILVFYIKKQYNIKLLILKLLLKELY
jgi:hypothetical protein